MKVKIFEPSVVAQYVDQLTNMDDFGFSALDDRTDRERVQYLAKMAEDERGGLRDVVVANSAVIKRLQQLYEHCPNFADAIGVIERAAMLSKETRTALAMPNILLSGPPGAGKSYFLHRVADALRIECLEQQCSAWDDTTLTGHSTTWKNARPGAIARTLIQGSSASVLVYLDEADKIPQTQHANLGRPPRLSLEPGSARAMIDTYLETPIRADTLLWLASANDERIDAQSAAAGPVLGNSEVHPPTIEQRRAIMRNVYTRSIARFGSAFDAELNDGVADTLCEATPRRMRMAIELAAGLAVAKGRRSLDVSDVRTARPTSLERGTMPSIGFFAGQH